MFLSCRAQKKTLNNVIKFYRSNFVESQIMHLEKTAHCTKLSSFLHNDITIFIVIYHPQNNSVSQWGPVKCVLVLFIYYHSNKLNVE